MIKRKCALIDAGIKSYEEGLELQKRAKAAVLAGEWDGIFILLEHLPVITLGRSHNTAELLWSMDKYTSHGIEIFPCNRGGRVTCHNIGQLVGYPILNLSHWLEDSHWYLRSLEQIIMNTVQSLGITAERKPNYTGVWVNDKKIAAIGISVRRWITGHGFALNVNNDLAIFRSVIPCGIQDFGVTSLGAEGLTGVGIHAVAELVRHEFQQVLQSSLQSLPLPDGQELSQPKPAAAVHRTSIKK